MNSHTAVDPSSGPMRGNSKRVYLPGLNGLRAIAALAVVFSHVTLALDDFGLNSKIFGTDFEGHARGLILAGYGVTIFFTLSGFLITFLLLKEKEIAGHVKVKDFYIRRILRIWPLYYLYFIVSIGTLLIYRISFNSSTIPFYIFLAANVPFIMAKSLPFLAHYWSLGVEEQFYLFFPQLSKLPNLKLLKVALVIIVVLLSLKFTFWFWYKHYNLKLPYIAISVTSFHTMLIGVIGAVLYYRRNQSFLTFATHPLAQIISWVCIMMIAINKFHLASVIDSELVSVVALLLIIGQVTKKNNLINLENPVCDFIGKISYGIYVIHPIVIFYFSKIVGYRSDNVFNYLLIYFMVTFATLILAYLSYEFYEKRFLKLKARFATVKSSSVKTNG